MDVLTFLGYAIMVVALLLAWALLYLIVWVVEKFAIKRKMFTKGVRRMIKYGSLALIFNVPAIQGYREDHPGPDFYKEQWTVFTREALPASAEQLSADYGSPDISGDYTVCVAYRLNEVDYRTLRERFAVKGYRSSNFGSGEEEWNVLAELNVRKDDFDLWVGKNLPNAFPTHHIGFQDSSRIVVLSGFRSL
jgi:hypothetical protein